ncbi:hypothetical protein [Sediminispirochaeta smaragdinae]|jgi:hypothetical protein|uniref:Uncharacterized protein n=1 Tax=Sediminispirochaeta smaragdinae (strain DSM 11293 / JCM 15392 / SEBR 4228) TaxID=573413 RepID=E1R562_SEDSS|nr:hypothetical protein [Sediminispirochaeta smaragdinae]ADK80597.1 hypothetical protein Spirs_1470 [Sediminispirochaeta smaragdinae DSM 11293]
MIPDSPKITLLAFVVIAGALLFAFLRTSKRGTRNGGATKAELELFGSLSAEATTLLNESALRWARQGHNRQNTGEKEGEAFPSIAYSPLLWRDDKHMQELLGRLHSELKEAFLHLPIALGNRFKEIEPLFDKKELLDEEHHNFVDFLIILRTIGKPMT